MAKIKTERAWLSSTTPSSLLTVMKGKRMPRQRRQIAVACCRRVINQMEDPESRRAVEVADRYLDGAASDLELEEAFLTARHVALDRIELAQRAAGPALNVAWNKWRPAYAAQLCAARSGAEEVVPLLLKLAANLGGSQEESEKAAFCAIIRDVIGNPFRPVPAVDPLWRAWNDGLIVKLAQQMYAEGAFTDMPILADALEDAGCTEASILTHCRSGGMHVRGCWVIELLLEKR